MKESCAPFFEESGKFFGKGVRKDFTKLRLLDTSLLLFAGNTEKRRKFFLPKGLFRRKFPYLLLA